jgi:hypothetical protein
VITDAHLGTAPLSVALEPQAGLASALRAGNGEPVLALEGIEGDVAQPIRIKVFVNKPGAGYQTSTEDAASLGFIQLLPSGGHVRPVSHVFDLSQIPGLDPAKPLQVTLVPVVGTDDAPPRDVSLKIARIYVRR